MNKASTSKDSQNEVANLKIRLQEAEDTLDAIRSGAIDAIVVEGEAEQQIFTLKSADYTYRMLIESMNQGALTISKEGIILYSNKQFSAMVDSPLEQIIGSSIQSFITPHQRSELSQLIKKQVTKNIEVTLESKQKHLIPVMLSATKLRSDDMSAHMCIVITDMTERILADETKNEFISLASHQLRTPATGVKQYLGMLLEGYLGELPEQYRVYLKTAYDCNERQLNIINDILKTAQIDSDLYVLQLSLNNLAELTSRVVNDYAPIFSMRNQKIITDIDETVSATMDPKEMYFVISNLIENASKYSQEGKPISVKVYKNSRDAIIEIKDNGVGILEADQVRIFDKFTRINNPVSDTVSGSGLGLYWVKRIVMLQNGTIKVSSHLNKGSTFKVSLPL